MPRPEPVIASESEAIQRCRFKVLDCFVALLPCANALRLSQAMTHGPMFSRPDLPEFCQIIVPPIMRGRRECRVFFAPVAPRAKNESTQISSPQVRRTFRHSLRNGFTTYSVLSP